MFNKFLSSIGHKYLKTLGALAPKSYQLLKTNSMTIQELQIILNKQNIRLLWYK